MDKARKKKIRNILTQITSLTNQLDYIKDYEDETRSRIPENLENSETYQKSEEYSDALSDAVSDIQSAVSTLEEVL